MSNVRALRYLKQVSLYKITKTRASNGALSQTYTLQGTYNVQLQEVTDSISVSLYGAKVDKMYRISSPFFALETLLKSKSNATSDNISDYMIVYNNEMYRITATREKWTDIEFVGAYEQNS